MKTGTGNGDESFQVRDGIILFDSIATRKMNRECHQLRNYIATVPGLLHLRREGKNISENMDRFQLYLTSISLNYFFYKTDMLFCDCFFVIIYTFKTTTW